MECARRLWSSGKLNSKGLTFKLLYVTELLRNYGKEKKLFISIVFCDFALWIFTPNENHSLLDNPLISIQDLNTNFHLEPKNRKPEI